MLFFNQSKVLLICLLTMLISSHVAYGNIEFSGHFGKKFGGKIGVLSGNLSLSTDFKNQPWHLGADTLYRISVNENANFGFGLRYRFDFQGERNIEGDDDDIYKFTTHRIALLVNYRFHIDQFFVGVVLGLDAWKYFKLSGEEGSDNYFATSKQFLWNRLSGQLGLEFGFMPTFNFLFKLEAGYDLFSFNDFEKEPDDNKMNLNGFYITLGIGLLFG